MTRHPCTLVLLFAACTVAHAGDGAMLLRVENCTASRTIDARLECDKRWKDAEKAHRQEQQQKQLDAARAAKKNTLCFKRRATQEVVCPN